MTINEANILLREWQKQLFLTEWSIKLKPFCRPEEMAMRNVVGCTEWVEPIKAARIEIMDEQFYGDHMLPFDFEKTLIHELLHLKFCLLGESGQDIQDRLMHQYIDEMARCLINVKRRGAKL